MKRILLVDDDPNDIALASAAFDTAGFGGDVMVARDGEEAMRLLQRRGEFTGVAGANPSVILLDLKMPRMTGHDVLIKLNEDERFRMIPVIIVTTSGDAREISKCYRKGANGYVIKPIEFLRFVKLINSICKFWIDFNEPPTGCIRSQRETSVEDG